ncbi:MULTISPECIES: hypothetical protein [unclassified Imperialibacter]|uniref:hypothetical protein n=1 Tax=unclassified Imperialibacter TaxID=2629706 RepID=UPI001257541C|nr:MULTISPECIES: hypothetical protein [unclassified Imperialibacter]CAD5254206.1 conserved hypothetical protein [Imperialibacter sp. 89]CAD5267152.1 conserved hypothetical protein [Imperialibacter sp. 75]VVT00697.1 conserved hypothetical protein [Imperialibacter sp. EC-SDR9]
MKLVTRNHLEDWADRVDSKGDLPYLISRLVRATAPTSTQADFPSGSAAYVGGWDGVVTCEEETAYVPKGISLWEFGTEADNKGKADEDYDKRKVDPLGYTQKDCVYIFVTLRFWKQKDKWIKAKKAEGIWKDVRVYDSSNLEQWLDIALSVSRWLSSRVGSYPFDGIMTADEFWEEWSMGPNGLVLQPEVVTAGREIEQKQLLKILQEQASIKAIKASTKNEAIAFIIAAAKQFPKSESERFFSKSLIIDTEGNFRGIRINTITPLNLIPRFDDAQPLYSAVGKGHHVLVPLGADDTFNQETIILPTIDRDGQVNSLIKSGISEDDAKKFSRESGRNITILKKLIGFPHTKTKWIDTENIREIIPALLLGRWNENFVGDIELIEKLSGVMYSDYLVTLTKWRNLEESPIMQIGETWRLTSPLDLWTNLSPHLTQKDFQNIQECFSFAFKNGNPIIEPKDKDDFAAFYNKQRKFSNWSREGIAQSLILIGRFGEGLNIPNLTNPQLWVDSLVHDLLINASGEIWISVDHELPLISEASPLSFLKAVSNSLLKEQPEIMDMFKEVEGFLHSTSSHTGLLWALEGLAWLPEYLREVGLILLKLSRLDPGGNLANRPINSISEIFKSWHYQTLSPFKERMEILKYITEKEKETGWTLLIRMLPDHHGVAHPTHKMRWRIFDKNLNLRYTYEEIYDTHSYVVSLLLDQFDNSEKKFSQLIEESVNLFPYDRKKVLDWADNIYPKVEQTEFTTWETIRKILNHHRSHPDADWTLPESELKRFEELYEKLKPLDVISQHIWLFNEHWPAFPEGAKYEKSEFEKRHDQQQKKIDDARNNAAKILLKELGLKKTLDLRKFVKESWTLGDALAKVITNQEEIISVCECLNDEGENLRFIRSFIFRKSIIEGFEWITTLFQSLQKKGFNNKSLVNSLLPIDQSKQLWDFVSTLDKEIQNEYWKDMYPTFYNIPVEEKIIGVQMLMEHKRFFSAIDISSHFAEELPTQILAELLKESATEEASEQARFKGYEIERIFETLDKRSDLDHSALINLEWLYIPLLDSYGTRRNPKVLQDELSKNPKFFVDMLKWLYIPKDKTKMEEERKGISAEVVQNRAKQVYHLFHSWKKIPGLKPDNSIDEEELTKWVTETRKIAEAEERLDVADMHIGQVLAQYPENIPEWPQEIIFKLIEEINSDSLNRSYSSAMFNKRGSSTRGPFDGGNIERDKAAYFGKLANDFKNKYPNVAEIFKRLEQGYLADAKRMDESAERDRLEY